MKWCLMVKVGRHDEEQEMDFFVRSISVYECKIMRWWLEHSMDNTMDKCPCLPTLRERRLGAQFALSTLGLLVKR
nr:hypothetical protein [Tanacetum cinerariifolium]